MQFRMFQWKLFFYVKCACKVAVKLWMWIHTWTDLIRIFNCWLIYKKRVLLMIRIVKLWHNVGKTNCIYNCFKLTMACEVFAALYCVLRTTFFKYPFWIAIHMSGHEFFCSTCTNKSVLHFIVLNFTLKRPSIFGRRVEYFFCNLFLETQIDKFISGISFSSVQRFITEYLFFSKVSFVKSNTDEHRLVFIYCDSRKKIKTTFHSWVFQRNLSQNLNTLIEWAS